MADPASGIFSVLNGSYKAINFVSQLSNVKAETGVVHEQLEQLDENLRELRNLLADKRIILDDERRGRINKKIYNATRVMDNVGKPIRQRDEERQANGTVCLYHRVTWVLKDRGTVELNQPLLASHQMDIIQEIFDLRAILREASIRGGVGGVQEDGGVHHSRGKAIGSNKKRPIAQPDPQAVEESEDLDGENSGNQNWLGWLQDGHIEQPKRQSSKRRKTKQSDFKWLHAELDEMSERESRRRSRSRTPQT